MLKSIPPSPFLSQTQPPQPILQIEQDETYLVRLLSWEDNRRQEEYQQLRTDIFVRSLGWQIPVDESGREKDRYDAKKSSAIRVYGVYGQGKEEYLLGGIRIFALQSWQDSMTVNEFLAANIIPLQAIQKLKATYDCHSVLELTRFCVVRGRRYRPLVPLETCIFDCGIVRDLLFACAISEAESSNRYHALALIASAYMRVLRRSFIFDEIYRSEAVSLIVIDPTKTVQAIRASGNRDQAERMLALCNKHRNINGKKY